MFQNKKTEQFALSCGIRRSTLHALSWILRRAKRNEICEIEIDLRKFNAWIAKYRGNPYDRKTIREIIDQLDNQTEGMIVFLKSYTPWVHKILVRPISFIEQQKTQKSGISPKLPTLDSMFDGDRKKRVDQLLLQNISRLDSLLKKLGLNCNQETLYRMWRYAGRKVENVKAAVEYMLQVNQAKIEYSRSFEDDGRGLESPIGWLHDCLKYKRYLNNDRQIIDLSSFDPILALAGYVDGVRPTNDVDFNMRYQT